MMEPYWGRQTFQYKAQEPILPPEPARPVDITGAELAALRGKLGNLEAEIAALKNRKTTTTIIHQGGDKGSAKTPTVSRLEPAPLLFAAHDLSKEPVPPEKRVTEYTLAPSTFLGCQVETAMNSDVEGYFTAKVHTHIYDTATGQHLLVPQGSTILGNDQSRTLVYGNERMDTISLTLTLPDGRSVELGRAPVTDQEGVAGLTGDVDQHYWRLFGAVFIGGALKGGVSAMQTTMTSAGGAGQVASGIAGMGHQATNNVFGPMLNTRPTIRVFAGQLCHVLLTKPLHLPAMWQTRASR
jgi:type IV secretion system protein VirB10